MDAAQLLRVVRRRLGLSQRALALRVGCSPQTVAGWESGRHSPTVALLELVLAAGDLDLVLVDRQSEPADAALRRHLHLSLTQRLRLALGEPAGLTLPTRTPVWAELHSKARLGQVVIEPPLATAIWLPLGQVACITVSIFHARTALDRGDIEFRLREGDAPPSLIPVPMDPMDGCAKVWVQPPAELARPSAEQSLLWRADHLLSSEAARDMSNRRRPAHRDPDASSEDYRVLQSAAAARRPDMRDGRAWRLGAPASLAQQLLCG